MLIPADIVSFESGDLAYTVGFERGEVSVDANAPASMTIRVTHIYRRIDGEWYLVHRHADFPPSDQRARDQGNAGSARALMSAVLLTAAGKRTLSKVRLGPSGSQPRICARSYSDRRPVFLRSSFAKGAGA
jgi:SnoaL-like domain